MDRKKELQRQYADMKPDMGIFMIKCNINQKIYLKETQNLKSMINRTVFELKMGSHKNKDLQNDWKEFGEINFETGTLELLKYDEDETKKDYSEELQILKIIWEEKFKNNKLY